MIRSLGNYWPIVIDIETSGVDFTKHAILEVAAIPLLFTNEGWTYYEVWHEHIQPYAGAEFNSDAMLVHGIDPDHPFRMALSERDWLQKWKKKLFDVAGANSCNRCMLVGHNAHFDLNFIMAAVNRCELKIPLHSFTCFDTATLGAFLHAETVLPKIINRAGLKYHGDSAHSASYDAEITAQLMVKWLNNTKI